MQRMTRNAVRPSTQRLHEQPPGRQWPGRSCSWLGSLLALVFGVGMLCTVALPLAAHARDRVRVVVIDAGHGGDDFGAIGVRGTLEKDVALTFAKALGKRLEQAGLRVVYTRNKDVFVSLASRTAIANIARADLFLSVHANSSPDSDVKGPETYFISLEASEGDAADVVLTENQVFKREGITPDSTDVVGAILGDLIRMDLLRVSSDVAAAIQQELAALPGPSRGVRQGKFIVLSGVNMPSVLIELGFLTNQTDEEKLNDRRYRDQLAEAIVRAVRGLRIVDRAEQRDAEARVQEGGE